MARLAPDDIVKLERDISLERLATAKGIKLTKSGATLTGTCPFHPTSKKPTTITISPTSNTWSCSKCKVTDGTVVQWMMKAEGVSKRHAIELLRADRGVGGGKVVKRSSTTKLPVAITATDDSKLMAQVVSYYADALTRNPKALDYIRRSGVTGADIIERFHVGLSDRTLGYRIPKANRKGGAEVRGRLHALGVLKETGHELLRGCVTIPLTDANGSVVSMYGRRMKLDTRTAETPDVWLNTKGLFNVEAFTASTEILLCSNPFEALIVRGAGVGNATAVHPDNFDELSDAIVKGTTTKVTILFPRTEEGETATTSIKEKLSRATVEVFRVLLPNGMDVSTFIAASASATEELKKLVRHAAWIGGVKPKGNILALPALVIETTPSTTPTTTSSTAGDILIEADDRRWRVRGLAKNLSYESLRVHLFVSRETNDPRTSGFYVDTLELYSARQRATFIEQAAEELGLDPSTVKRDLGAVLLKLEALQAEQIKETLKAKDAAPTMSEADRASALTLLRDPKLIDRILTDLDTIGVVGESTNKLLGYLATVSRKLADPLAVLVQSSSAAGKSSLLDAVLSFVPEEERVEYSAMSGQSLYYFEPGALRHRVLAISEEEGAQRASYALKLLQSQGALSIASTAKQAGTGRMITHEYRVDGPVALMLTTTATTLDDELLNRCIVLSINESPEQTKAIHRRQREGETLDGVLARRRREEILRLHRNAQRLLRTVVVVNPYANDLTCVDTSTRARRDHKKLLTLIRTIALLHQHQRDVKKVEDASGTVEYIEATKGDIEIAERLMSEVSATDELPPHTRHVLGLLEGMVTTACTKRKIERLDYRFTRREARQQLGLGGTQLWTHLRRLVDAEYVVVHPSRHGRGVVYELLGDVPPERSAYIRGADRTISSKKNEDLPQHSVSARPRKIPPASSSKSRRTSTSNGGA